MTFQRLRSIPTMCILLGVFAFACSSKQAPSEEPNGSGENEGPLGSCYPATGDYLTHYTRTAGDPKVCADIPDKPATITSWDGEMPSLEGCTVTPDKASCTVDARCEFVEDGTTTKYAMIMKLAEQSASGTVHTVVSGGSKADCTYEFTYTKQ